MNDVKFVKPIMFNKEGKLEELNPKNTIPITDLLNLELPVFPKSYRGILNRVKKWQKTKEVRVSIEKGLTKNGNRYSIDIYSLNRYFEKEFGFEIIKELEKL